MRILSHNALRVLILAALVSLPRAAAADPVIVTGGHVDVHVILGLTRVLFEGEDFFLRVGTDGFVNSLGVQCVPCVPGAMVDFGGNYNFPIAGGTAEVDGVTYPEIFPDMTGTFVTPSIRVEGSETVTLSVPFTYSGTVAGFLEHPFTRGADALPVFTKSLVGSGTATATFILNNQEQPLFTATDLRYDFEAAEPIPEPATVALWSVGAAVLAARRRRGLRR